MIDFNSIALAELVLLMNKEPLPHEVKEKDGRKYIPIGFLEAKLDEMFQGLWQTENVSSTIVANEICVTLELKVFYYPIGQWVTRIGAGAAMIQQRGYPDPGGDPKKKIPAKPSDVDAKISNTMAKDFAHAKAEAFKNACKSFGKWFGRDLNRDMDKTNQSIHIATTFGERMITTKLISECESIDDLLTLYDVCDNLELKQAFGVRKMELIREERKRSQEQKALGYGDGE
jgi:hypothetical protein